MIQACLPGSDETIKKCGQPNARGPADQHFKGATELVKSSLANVVNGGSRARVRRSPMIASTLFTHEDTRTHTSLPKAISPMSDDVCCQRENLFNELVPVRVCTRDVVRDPAKPVECERFGSGGVGQELSPLFRRLNQQQQSLCCSSIDGRDIAERCRERSSLTFGFAALSASISNSAASYTCALLRPVSRACRRARVASAGILARSRCDREARVALGHLLARSSGKYSDRPNTQQALSRCANYTTAKADALKDASSGAAADQADTKGAAAHRLAPVLPRSPRTVRMSG